MWKVLVDLTPDTGGFELPFKYDDEAIACLQSLRQSYIFEATLINPSGQAEKVVYGTDSAKMLPPSPPSSQATEFLSALGTLDESERRQVIHAMEQILRKGK